MSRGLIFYSRADYGRNSWFANQCILYFEQAGIKLSLIIIDDIIRGINGNGPYIKYKEEYIYNSDFAIVRTIDPDLTLFLEQMKIRCFNNFYTSKICNNKNLAYAFAAGIGVHTVPTLCSSYNDIKIAVDEFKKTGYKEIIIKTVDGHGGKQVFLLEDTISNINDIVPEFLSDKQFCVQPRIGKTARDLRVYVLNNEVYASVLRQSKNSFKSNFTLGGTCSLYELSSDELKIVNKIVDSLPADFVGIDFIIDDNNNLVFNEIEDVVGTRMLFELGKNNIIYNYVRYIIGNI